MNMAIERQQSNDFQWAVGERSMFFEEKGSLHSTFHRMAQRLKDLRVPYGCSNDSCRYRRLCLVSSATGIIVCSRSVVYRIKQE